MHSCVACVNCAKGRRVVHRAGIAGEVRGARLLKGPILGPLIQVRRVASVWGAVIRREVVSVQPVIREKQRGPCQETRSMFRSVLSL